MLNKTLVEAVIDKALSGGAEFAEIFAEESNLRNVSLSDQKIDDVGCGTQFGIGLRLISKDDFTYGYTNVEGDLIELAENLSLALKDKAKAKSVPLAPQVIQDRHAVRIAPSTVSGQARTALLRQIDEKTRSHSQHIRQVTAGLSEKQRSILIANSEGLWAEDSRSYSRVRLAAIAQKESEPQVATESPGKLGGYEFFEQLAVDELAESAASSALRMADAGYIEGGMMPVIIGNGFGGVIFHEACGHPLETEAIRRNASPFCNKVGEFIAQEILTAIDDGTMDHYWGSLNIDDEGTPAQRTILIENGRLKNYMSDRIGAQQLGRSKSGSARRESYRYAPVSRMRNTYIAPGTDSIDDMIKSIDYGLYARKMGGGSVDPSTGEFNFAVQEGYVIKNGQIDRPVRGATLIGKGYEILPRISMIGSDLELAAGMCGASSGWVPTTVGQPTLKIDNILVGGR